MFEVVNWIQLSQETIKAWRKTENLSNIIKIMFKNFVTFK